MPEATAVHCLPDSLAAQMRCPLLLSGSTLELCTDYMHSPYLLKASHSLIHIPPSARCTVNHSRELRASPPAVLCHSPLLLWSYSTAWASPGKVHLQPLGCHGLLTPPSSVEPESSLASKSNCSQFFCIPCPPWGFGNVPTSFLVNSEPSWSPPGRLMPFLVTSPKSRRASFLF